ncbi:MAG: sulfotransferase [Proteobacteria bacterium]|nr:sulfotransferase [Pseudomonadota bacterium]
MIAFTAGGVLTLSTDFEAVERALRGGDASHAATLALQAVRAGASHPLVCRLAAEALERSGALGEAIGTLRRGLEQAPRDVSLLTALGAGLTRAGRSAEAIRALRAAVAADPEAAEAYWRLGEIAAGEGEVDAARAAFERAVQADPAHVEALAALAYLLARTGRAEEARAPAERALARSPAHGVANLAQASVEIAERRWPEAEARVQRLLMSPGSTPNLRAAAYGLLGDARHGAGRAAEAFRAYTTCGLTWREAHGPRLAAQEDGFVTRLQDLTDRIARTPASAWKPMSVEREGPASRHVFLVGFPRSGTTLLEQVLAAHPAVTTLEEKPTLQALEERYLTTVGGLEELLAVTPERAARFRREYWERVRGLGGRPDGKVFVDKLPMNLVNLPLIARLFPGAKVLFALRDPRDVVLSAFRRAFAPNAVMHAFSTPEGAARMYDRTMALAETCKAKMPLELRQVRYERLVAEFETEAREICAFLGIGWHPGMAEFAALAQGRTINTPSAAQVREGLYRHGEGQWLAYRAQLAAILPTLAPWVARFGYAPSP